MHKCLLSSVCCPFKDNEWKIPSMTSHLSEPTFTDPKSAWLGSFTNRGRRGQAWEHILMLESGGGRFFNDLSMDSTVKSRPAVGSKEMDWPCDRKESAWHLSPVHLWGSDLPPLTHTQDKFLFVEVVFNALFWQQERQWWSVRTYMVFWSSQASLY